MDRVSVQGIVAASLLALGLWAPPLHAQGWSTRLPTPYAGDYLNGAATSDAAGGAFAGEGRRRGAPAVSFGVPTAFGAAWRDAFAAVGGHLGRSRGEAFYDGALFLGTGFGEARRYAGLEATLAVYDLVGDTFKERSLSVKVHRRLGRRWAVAAGVENLLIAGNTDGGRSAYLVTSAAVTLPEGPALGPRRLTLTAGVGDGRFNAVSEVRRGNNGASLFGSLALELTPRLAALASWTGQDLILGVSVVPFERWPVVVTPVLLDVEGRGGHGARVAMSVGAALRLNGPDP